MATMLRTEVRFRRCDEDAIHAANTELTELMEQGFRVVDVGNWSEDFALVGFVVELEKEWGG